MLGMTQQAVLKHSKSTDRDGLCNYEGVSNHRRCDGWQDENADAGNRPDKIANDNQPDQTGVWQLLTPGDDHQRRTGKQDQPGIKQKGNRQSKPPGKELCTGGEQRPKPTQVKASTTSTVFRKFTVEGADIVQSFRVVVMSQACREQGMNTITSEVMFNPFLW